MSATPPFQKSFLLPSLSFLLPLSLALFPLLSFQLFISLPPPFFLFLSLLPPPLLSLQPSPLPPSPLPRIKQKAAAPSLPKSARKRGVPPYPKYILTTETEEYLKKPTFDIWHWEPNEMISLIEHMYQELGLVAHFHMNPLTLHSWLVSVWGGREGGREESCGCESFNGE